MPRCPSGKNFRQPFQRGLDRFLGVGEVLQFAAEVAAVGTHVEVAVTGKIAVSVSGLIGLPFGPGGGAGGLGMSATMLCQ